MNKNQKKTLFFITDSYPFGYGESFIENEINYLSESFETIFIISKNAKNIQTRQVPKNCKVYRISKDYKKLFEILLDKYYLSDLINNFDLKNLKKLLTFQFCSKLVENKIIEIIKKYNLKKENIIIYSYWFYNGAYAGTILKRKKIAERVVSRAHGYDIFFERGPQFFKSKILKKLEILVPACYNSELYLKKKYPKYKKKIEYSHLGVSQPFNIGFGRKYNKNLIISCSNIIKLKRVDLIIESLQYLTHKNLCWVHIGSGIQKKEIVNLAEDKLKNISFRFLGQLSNVDVLNFYKLNREKIICMIHLSETEGGTPVSMMEAQSFGIPIIATNVGGINEIVNNKTGILLSANPEVKEIIDSLEKMINLSDEKYKEYEIASYRNWEKNFNAEKNYKSFINNCLFKMNEK